MDTNRYRALAAVMAVASALALAAPRLLASRPAIPRASAHTGAVLVEGTPEAAPASRPFPPPEKIAPLFGWAPAPAIIIEQAAAPQTEAKKADWIRPMGKMEEGDGVSYLFFKDEHAGRVFRVRLDGKPEGDAKLIQETTESFTISIDDETYVVPRRR
jgi:hypothetical protein